MSKEKILSSDGIPLEESLKKAERKNKLKAVLLVAPLFLFILIIYIFPIGDMLFRSVDDRMITKMLPNTFKAMEKWDGRDLPDEPVYKAIYDDLKYLKENKTYGKIIARLNYEKSGFSSLIKKTVRKLKKIEEGNYKAVAKLDDGNDLKIFIEVKDKMVYVSIEEYKDANIP